MPASFQPPIRSTVLLQTVGSDFRSSPLSCSLFTGSQWSASVLRQQTGWTTVCSAMAGTYSESAHLLIAKRPIIIQMQRKLLRHSLILTRKQKILTQTRLLKNSKTSRPTSSRRLSALKTKRRSLSTTWQLTTVRFPQMPIRIQQSVWLILRLLITSAKTALTSPIRLTTAYGFRVSRHSSETLLKTAMLPIGSRDLSLTVS